MIRYKLFDSDEWFETDEVYHYNGHYIFNHYPLEEVDTYSFRFWKLVEFDANEVRIDKCGIYCNDNYLKRFNVLNKIAYLQCDNLQIIGNCQEIMIFCINC